MARTLHMLGLPHTQTTSRYLTCAYTQKAVKACKMFSNLGYKVILYAGEENEAECAEHVPLLQEAERQAWFGDFDPNDPSFGGVSWDPQHDAWQTMNTRAVRAILDRAEEHDNLLLLSGWCQQPVADALSWLLLPCEWAVGYEGITANHCAFESYAWMHHVYGLKKMRNGRWYDTVIPNFFDPEDFSLRKKGDYLLYIGRLVQRKGPHVAAEIADRLGMRLLVAGAGALQTRPGQIITPELAIEGDHVEYVGPVDREARRELLASARACLIPTLYIEPFGGVAVEAMLSGTPAVTSDFGAFTETVQEGVSGYRFHTLAEGVAATTASFALDPSLIRAYALGRYSLSAVGQRFDRWFRRLDQLWEDGWDSEEEPGAPRVDYDERALSFPV